MIVPITNEYKEAPLLVLSFPTPLHFPLPMIHSSAYCYNDNERRTGSSVFVTEQSRQVFTPRPAIILAWGKYFFTGSNPACLSFSPLICDESPSGTWVEVEVQNSGKKSHLGGGGWDKTGNGQCSEPSGGPTRMAGIIPRGRNGRQQHLTASCGHIQGTKTTARLRWNRIIPCTLGLSKYSETHVTAAI